MTDNARWICATVCLSTLIQELNKVISLLSNVMTVCAFLISVVVFANFSKWSNQIRWLGALYLTSFLANLIADILVMAKITQWINFPSSFYILFSTVWYGKVYQLALPRWKRSITWAVALITAFALINFALLQKSEYNSYTMTLSATLVLVLAIVYFHQLMSTLPTVSVHRLPMFWFNTAFLIFSASTIVLFIFRAYLADNRENWEELAMFWIFHNSLSIAHMMLAFVGLYHAHMDLKRQFNATIR